MVKAIRRFMRGKSGATAVEYSLVASLVAISATAGLTEFGDKLIEMYAMLTGILDGVIAEVAARAT